MRKGRVDSGAVEFRYSESGSESAFRIRTISHALTAIFINFDDRGVTKITWLVSVTFQNGVRLNAVAINL